MAWAVVDTNVRGPSKLWESETDKRDGNTESQHLPRQARSVDSGGDKRRQQAARSQIRLKRQAFGIENWDVTWIVQKGIVCPMKGVNVLTSDIETSLIGQLDFAVPNPPGWSKSATYLTKSILFSWAKTHKVKQINEKVGRSQSKERFGFGDAEPTYRQNRGTTSPPPKHFQKVDYFQETKTIKTTPESI